MVRGSAQTCRMKGGVLVLLVEGSETSTCLHPTRTQESKVEALRASTRPRVAKGRHYTVIRVEMWRLKLLSRASEKKRGFSQRKHTFLCLHLLDN